MGVIRRESLAYRTITYPRKTFSIQSYNFGGIVGRGKKLIITQVGLIIKAFIDGMIPT